MGRRRVPREVRPERRTHQCGSELCRCAPVSCELQYFEPWGYELWGCDLWRVALAGPAVTGQPSNTEPPERAVRSDARQDYDDMPAGTRRWMLLKAILRPTLIFVGLLLLYYLLPLWDRHARSAAVWLTFGMILVAVLLTWQVRKISTAKYPRLRATEALALTLPLFILIFATVYFGTGRGNPRAFSQVLSRTDSLYFTVTVFSTVGFGDIVPVTETARVMVIIQMLGDLALVGVVARVILGEVQSGLHRSQSRSHVD